MIEIIEEDDKKLFLKIAKDSILAKLVNEPLPKLYKFKNIHYQRAGVFIKLKIDNIVRGYTGIIETGKDLVETIQEVAVNSAFNDIRFNPLKREEYEKLKIEIYIIKNIIPLKEKNAFKIGKDGIYLKCDNNAGIIFPDDIGTLEISNIDEYLELSELKAGILSGVKNIEYFIVDFEKIES